MTADEIKSALNCGRQGCECARSRVKTHCPGPSHQRGDRDPSLGVNEKDGKVLVSCYGGCSQPEVIAALQGRGLWARPHERNGHAAQPTRLPTPIAEFAYPDQFGETNFWVVKFPPPSPGAKKTFKQKRPLPGGGVAWEKGDTRLLYRLPALLAAPKDQTVWLCEGEKDADRLTSLGLVATTCAGGAKKWNDAHSAWLSGRTVVILEDNDTAGREDVLIKRRGLRQAGAHCAILSLPDLPLGGDVSDWLDAGGPLEELERLGEAALKNAPSPEIKVVPPPSLAPFPVEILPPSLRGLVTAAAKAMEVPPDFVAVPLLVLVGAVIGNAWEIELKRGWREGPNLYAAVVGDPGSKKTPALKIAMRALHAVQERLSADYKARKVAYEEAKALWERTPKKERGAPPEPPGYQHVWTADATTEALAGMLSGSKGMVLIRDELVGWVKSMDAYRAGGKGADRQNYLSMWSRSPIKIDRKGSPEPIIVSQPCLAVFGGIQPDMLPDLADQAQRDDGFIDRLLFSYQDIGPDRWSNADVDEAVEAAVERLFERLYDTTGATMPDGAIIPRVARLDRDALKMWGQWYDANAAERESDALPASVKGTWAKLPSQLARLALILHVANACDRAETVGTWISAQTLVEAADLVEYFKLHARAALSELRTTRPAFEERIRRGVGELGSCTTRTIHIDILHNSVKYGRLKSTLERMLEDGKIAVADMPPTAAGGRPGKLWSLPDQEEKGKKVDHRNGHAKDFG